MAQVDNADRPQPDDLDAFFAAADQKDWDELHHAAENLAKPAESGAAGFTHPAWDGAFKKKAKPPATPAQPDAAPDSPPPAPLRAEPDRPAPERTDKAPPPDKPADEGEFALSPEEEAALLGDAAAADLEGKFIAIDPASIPGAAGDPDKPFVLIPAHVHQHVPLWGWALIGVTMISLFVGVMILPGVTLARLTSRLGDADESTARVAMRQLVMNGDERTVRKLYDVAASPRSRLATRLRAVDAMTLIERVPEVDRALLRLELSADTHDQVREAAIAARRQREAYRSRSGR